MKKLFKRCSKCGKRLIWKKDRKFGGFNVTMSRGKKINVPYCAKCGKRMLVDQANAMRKVGFNV